MYTYLFVYFKIVDNFSMFLCKIKIICRFITRIIGRKLIPHKIPSNTNL